VIWQAAVDHHEARYREETSEFFLSGGFDWVWQQLTDGVVGMASAAIVKERVLHGELCLRRRAYHAGKPHKGVRYD
jgi:hypothetical protein